MKQGSNSVTYIKITSHSTIHACSCNICHYIIKLQYIFKSNEYNMWGSIKRNHDILCGIIKELNRT